jgi:hypothetical protein
MGASPPIAEGAPEVCRSRADQTGAPVRGGTDGVDNRRVQWDAEQGAIGAQPIHQPTAKSSIDQVLCDELIVLSIRVPRIARPLVLVGSINDSGANRIQLDVATAREEIVLGIDEHRPEAAFPKRAGASLSFIDGSHETASHVLQHAGGAFLDPRRDQEMNMVGHQDVRVDLAAMSVTGDTQRVTIFLPILGPEEHGQPIVPSMDEVEGYVGDNQSWKAGHGTVVEAAKIATRDADIAHRSLSFGIARLRVSMTLTP